VKDYTPEQWAGIAKTAQALLVKDPTNARARRAFNAARPHLAQQREAANAADVAGAAPGKLATFGLGASQAATLGLGDEAAGLLAGLWAPFIPGGESNPLKAYASQRDETRQATRAGREANPLSYIAGEVAGTLPTLAVPVARIAKLGPAGRLAGSIATGGLLGGVEGAARSEGDLEDRATAGGVGAAIGAGAAALPVGASLAWLAGRKLAGLPGRVAGRVAGTIRREAAPAAKAAQRALREVERFDIAPPQGTLRTTPAPRRTPTGLDIPTYQRRPPLGLPEPRPGHPIYHGEAAPTRSPEVRGGEPLLPKANPTIGPVMAKLRTMSTAQLVESFKNAPKELRDLLIVEFQRRHITIPDLGIRPLSLLGS